MSERTGKSCTIAALLAWIALQLYTDVDILASTFCTVSFSSRTRAFWGAWCMCLLLLDILLYFFGSRRLLRELRWYWIICLAGAAVLPVAGRVSILIAALLPYGQMFFFSYALLWEGVEVLSWDAVNACAFVLTLLLSAAHVGWMVWLSRRNHEGDTAGRRLSGALLLPVWAVFQLISGVDTLFNSSLICGAYATYTAWSWITLGLWCLGLLGLSGALFSAGQRRLLRGLRWYWLFCALSLAAVLVLPPLLEAALPVRLLYAALTPLFQLLALCWFFLQKSMGLSWETARSAGVLTGLLLCLVQFAYMTWLLRRGGKEGVGSHGSVDPGTGVLEPGN